jgi:hypothetical protein
MKNGVVYQSKKDKMTNEKNVLLRFIKGRYYLSNGLKAIITNITAMHLEGFILIEGFVLIPDNIWVPTFWYKDGTSIDKNFNLDECVENHEDKLTKWLISKAK